MSAINLPVEAYQGHDGSWIVNDQTARLCQSLTKDQANQIALALSLHDDLVNELERVKDLLGGQDYQIVSELLERTKS